MKKHMTAEIYLTGSKKYINRTIWIEDGKPYIKWHRKLAEVYNWHHNGIPMVSRGWRTVEDY